MRKISSTYNSKEVNKSAWRIGSRKYPVYKDLGQRGRRVRDKGSIKSANEYDYLGVLITKHEWDAKDVLRKIERGLVVTSKFFWGRNVRK